MFNKRRRANYIGLFCAVQLSTGLSGCNGDDYVGLADRTIDPGQPGAQTTDVNLVVASFAMDTEITPVNPDNPGDWETVSAIIQNIGTTPLEGSGHIDIGYFLSTDDNITVDDIYLGDTSVFIGDSFTQSDVAFGFELLSPGENYQYDHQLAVPDNIAPDTYYVGAIVDYIEEYRWYTFPRATDTKEFAFPSHVTVAEANETDNVRLLTAHQVTVTAPIDCVDDAFEPDSLSASATPIALGEIQNHNFCRDNSDWLQFDAVQGGVYKISTHLVGLDATETDTQLILYDRDGSSILLFHDNIGNDDDDDATNPPTCPPFQENNTVDLACGWPIRPRSEIVWEAQESGTYFVKVRTTSCDEDLDDFCETTPPVIGPNADFITPFGSPDGPGLHTEYIITLQ